MQLTCYNIGCIIIFSLTEAFVNGKCANNILLYGDAGTGKSTTIRTILGLINETSGSVYLKGKEFK